VVLPVCIMEEDSEKMIFLPFWCSHYYLRRVAGCRVVPGNFPVMISIFVRCVWNGGLGLDWKSRWSGRSCLDRYGLMGN